MDFTFQENMEVKTLDTVPEQFRSFYKDKGDSTGFRVDSDNVVVKGAVESIGKLHATLKAVRGELSTANQKKSVDLGPLSDYGTDVPGIATYVKEKISGLTTQLDEAGKGGKVNIEKIKEEIAKANSGDMQKKDKRIEGLTGQLYKLLVENAAQEAISTEKGEATLLMPFVKEKVKVAEEDGVFKVFVVDAQGDRRFSGTTGGPMTLNELVKEMKGHEKFQRLFNSDRKEGGGGSPNHSNSGLIKKGDGEKSAVDKISSGLKKGQFSGARG